MKLERGIIRKDNQFEIRTTNIMNIDEAKEQLKNTILTIEAYKGRLEQTKKLIAQSKENIKQLERDINDFEEVEKLISSKLSKEERDKVYKEIKAIIEKSKQKQ